LKLKYDEPLINFAFNLELRPSSEESLDAMLALADADKAAGEADGQGLTLGHVRAQLEQLQDTYMS